MSTDSRTALEPSAVPDLPSLTVGGVGFLPRKTERVNVVFPYWAIGLVLAGEGSFQVQPGPAAPLRAPCAFFVWNGPRFDYGPHPGAAWHERYIVVRGPRAREWETLGWLSRRIEPMPLSRDFAAWLEAEHERIAQPFWNQSGDLVEAKLRLENLVYSLHRHVEARARATAPPEHGPLLELLEKWKKDPPRRVDLQETAADLGMSYSHFRAEFRRLCGTGPASFLRVRRIDLAARLLTSEEASIKEAAWRAGYEHLESFYRAFTRLKGLPPGALAGSIKALHGGSSG